MLQQFTTTNSDWDIFRKDSVISVSYDVRIIAASESDLEDSLKNLDATYDIECIGEAEQ